MPDGKYDAETYLDRFGSWTNAIEQAGFEPRTQGSSITDEQLLTEIHRLANGDTPPTCEQINRDGKYGYGTYHRRFGSWNAVVEQAGFEPRNRQQNASTEAQDE